MMTVQDRAKIAGYVLFCFLFSLISVQAAPILASVQSSGDLHQGNNSSVQKISTDLLQLIDPAYCSPGKTSADVAREMEVFGQLRYVPGTGQLVHVSISLQPNSTGTLPASYLRQPVIDPGYHLLSGWLGLSNLTTVANLSDVVKVRSILSPVSSGMLSPLPSDTNTSIPNASLSSVSANNSSTVPVNVSPGGWEKKTSTDLLQLLDDNYLSPGQNRTDAENLMKKTGELRISSNRTEVSVIARTNPGSASGNLTQFFSSSLIDPKYGRIVGWIPISNLTALASMVDTIAVMTQLPPITSRVSTGGDLHMNTSLYRNMTNLTGKGVKVGVISDGVDHIDEVTAEGELSNVTVLSNAVGGSEGTAMLEIIHDIAPDAELYFHDRGTNQIEYVQAMDRLISSGCRVICDDITYIEPFFEDGYIAQNIRDRILSYDILYVSAAGNFAEEHYQGTFNGYENKGYYWQNFSVSANSSRDLTFSVPPSCAGHVVLQWDDPVGKSDNNYDLFLYGDDGHEVARSVNVQDGDDDPMEWVRFVNEKATSQNFSVKVVLAGGVPKTIELYVLPVSGTPLVTTPHTQKDSIFGQQSVNEGITVSAVRFSGSGYAPESYSSQGPVTIIRPQEQRQKPDIAAPDGVTVSAGGGLMEIFSGTSASAPHIAGLAALIWSGTPNSNQSDIKKEILSSVSHPGTWDPAVGFGVPDCVNLKINLSTLIDKNCIPNSTPSFKPRENENSASLDLYPGWNMVSIPYPLSGIQNMTTLFSSVNTSCHTIWSYSPALQKWRAMKEYDTMGQMDVIWIYSTEKKGITMSYDTSSKNQTTRHLSAGWNPLGIPGKETITARDQFSGIADAWSCILIFDPQTQQFRPSIINGGNDSFSDNRLLYPTEGFWMFMNKPAIFMP